MSNDIEARTHVLAKSWGVDLGDSPTLSTSFLALMEKLYSQQAEILRQLQNVHAEQTKMWIRLRGKGKP